jgi:cytochrome c oxidase subunit III
MTPVSTRTSGHNGASLPPRAGGGGDDENMPDFVPNYGERLRLARFGLAVAMTPILVLFISFTVVYLFRRGYLGFEINDAFHIRTWIPVRLPWIVLFANTAVLIASSVTIDLARRAITREAALAPIRSMPGILLGEERTLPWLVITTVLGVVFLGGQLFVWSKLSAAGFHLAGGTSSSFIYILTAMHGLHLAGGVLALIGVNVAAVLQRPVETRRIVVDIASWYWHCMTGLWIYILILFSFAAR